MSKTMIAVLLAGTLEAYQHDIIEGIVNQAKEDKTTVHIFQCINGDQFRAEFDEGEYNIFSLCDFDNYDGIIFVYNTITMPDANSAILEKISNAKCPVVTIDYKNDKTYFVGVDNKEAERTLVNHIIREHNCRDILFVTGNLNNAEAVERFRGYKQALADNGIEFDRKKVVEGHFEWEDGERALKHIESKCMKMPQAIVCSNDIAANGTFVALLKRRIRVPEDVIVTGFDNLQNSTVNGKWITTIDRDLTKSGRLAVSTIKDLLAGRKVQKEQYIDFIPVYSGTCGCDAVPATRNIGLAVPDATVYVKNSVYNFCRMLSGINCFVSMPEILEALKEWIIKLNCREFYLCLCEDWEGKEAFESTENEQCMERFHRISGYSDKMLCVLNYTNGEFNKASTFDKKDVMPGGGNRTEGYAYVITPLHFQERCFGYCICANENFDFESGIKITTYSHNITNALEIIRRENQLRLLVSKFNRMSMSDGLTGIYNRSGFLNTAGNIIDSNFAKDTPMFVGYFDLDGLKTINDNLGHEEGDTAIKILANTLASCARHGDVCGRLGGDEFAYLGVGYTADEIDELMSKITKALEVYNEHSENKFVVSTSFGYHAFHSSEDMTLSDYLDIADGKMYRNKYDKKKNRK